jgi:hypothetical protein
MYPFSYAFRDPQAAIPSLEPALGSINPENTRLIMEELTNDCLAQVP